MQKGAFPKNWALFMGDLIRGMILDMIWPELKNTIEEFTYAKGVRINRACGIDPNQIQLEIGLVKCNLTKTHALCLRGRKLRYFDSIITFKLECRGMLQRHQKLYP